MNITQCDLPYPDLSQRTQYSKGGISRKYWDYRDQRIFSYIKNERRILDIGCGEGITLQKILHRLLGKKLFVILNCLEIIWKGFVTVPRTTSPWW